MTKKKRYLSQPLINDANAYFFQLYPDNYNPLENTRTPGEIKLLQSILISALYDLGYFYLIRGGSYKKPEKHLQRHAEKWFCDKSFEPFSLNWVLQHLGIERSLIDKTLIDFWDIYYDCNK